MAMSCVGAAAVAFEGVMGISSKQREDMKVRKPYTITKQRESWTEQEHHKFLEALRLYDRDWKKIEAFVGTKTIIQIRSHAQKYFLKVQKNGTGEHVPPPRPKRKSSQPYPQKAPTSKASGGVSASQGFSDAPERSNFSVDEKSRSSGDFAHSKSGRPWTNNTQAGPSKMTSLLRGEGKCNAPDFAGVYSFLGGLFDPAVKKHNERLKAMEPIDRETVLLLMRNLVINLATPEVWEEQRNLLSQTRRLGLVKDAAKADIARQADSTAPGTATTSAAAQGQPSVLSVQAMPPTPTPTPSMSNQRSSSFSTAGPPRALPTRLSHDVAPSTSMAPTSRQCMASEASPRVVKMPALSTFGSNRWAQTAMALANSRVMEESTMLGSEADMPKITVSPKQQLVMPQEATQTVDVSPLPADTTADLDWWAA
eukprot:jgi/Chlat1/6486/Chrsp45S06062